MIERFALKNFTAFDRIKINFSPGVNVLIGENGTGKTHLLKGAYALASSGLLKNEGDALFETALMGMLLRLFMPLEGKIAALRKWGSDGKAVLAADFSSNRRVSAVFGEDEDTLSVMDNNYPKHYIDNPVFIPSKEVLSFMKGFGSLFDRYELSFDQGYRNIALVLDVPQLRANKLETHTRRIMDAIEKICGGHLVFYGGGRVSFKSDEEEYSANATAEGYLHLGLLYRLLENGSVRPGESGPLFWDEPETGLNPKMLKILAWILLEMARNGQQIILTTHSYALLKYFELLQDKHKGDSVRFHSLYRDEDKSIKLESVDNYNHLSTNAIIETYLNLYDTEIEHMLGGEAK